MRVAVIVFALTILTGCQGMIDSRIDSYMETIEDRAIRDSASAAMAVGAPIDIYDPLWDKDGDPAKRLKMAGQLTADLIRNAVPPESIVHVSLSVAVMLAHQYKGDK
jgi:hypothetical protein